MANITIDGTEHDIEDLSDETKRQLTSLQFVDAEINRLQMSLAALQTARNTYASAVRGTLGDQSGSEDPDSIEIEGENITFDE